LFVVWLFLCCVAREQRFNGKQRKQPATSAATRAPSGKLATAQRGWPA
jgi:hypothetical protein